MKKITEKAALIKLTFSQNHSTESTLIKVLNGIYLNTDLSKTSALVLLDLSSASDILDLTI